MKVIVSAPATTANLGPGYDCLGLALSLRSTFTLETAAETVVEGCDEAFRGPDNLVLQGFREVWRQAGREAPAVRLVIDAAIPVSRGLGSSSTCIVAGAAAANAMLGERFTKDELFQICSAFEGHPDNAGPCIFGGLTASFAAHHGGCFHSLPMPVDPEWRFAAVIPDYEVKTSEARKAMPKTIPVADSVFTTSHAIAMLRALATGDERLLAEAAEDRLHEPCRRKLIPDWHALQAAARDAGAAAFLISGSGSTMIALTKDDAVARDFLNRAAAAFPGFSTRLLRASGEGVTVRTEEA